MFRDWTRHLFRTTRFHPRSPRIARTLRVGEIPVNPRESVRVPLSHSCRFVIFVFAILAAVDCAAQSVVTQHNNNARQGAQLAETKLTPMNVGGPDFGLLYDRHVLGTILAQPLYVHAAKINGQLRNIVVIATAEDLVYAFDADDTSLDTIANVTVHHLVHNHWPHSTSVLDEVTSMEESTKWLWRASVGIPYADDGLCSEISPAIIGITSTPVIDLSSGTLYVVSRDDSSGGGNHDYLTALDLTTGFPSRRVQIKATDTTTGLVFNDKCQRQRPGLLLLNGSIYLGYATLDCDRDCPNQEPWRGWVLGFHASDFSHAGVFTNSKNFKDGGMGIWASGNGLAGSDDGFIFYQNGNDKGPKLADLGDAFVKLQNHNDILNVQSHYRPPFANDYRSGDTDVGSGGPMLLPTRKLIGGGKDGVFFVLSQEDLSLAPLSFQAFYNTFHLQPGTYPYNNPQTYNAECSSKQLADMAKNGTKNLPCFIKPEAYKKDEQYGPNIHAGPVFWQDSATHGFIYKMAEKDFLKSFDYDITSGSVGTSPAFVATVRPGADGMPGGFSSISANGTRDGIVWTIVQQADSQGGPPTPAILYAHDATNLQELWSNCQDAAAFAKFTAPTIADGRVFLPSFNLFQVYGLGAARRGIQYQTVSSALKTKWRNLGGVQGLLGRPWGPPKPLGKGAMLQEFVGSVGGGGYGHISVPPSTTIEAAMCAANGLPTPKIVIRATVISSNSTGTHYVIGEIRDQFVRHAGVRRFGFPLTDETPTPDGLGLMTRFEHGTIFWYAGHHAKIGEPKYPNGQDELPARRQRDRVPARGL